MKKQLLLFVLMLLPVVASADDSGKCGDNVYYSYNEANHTLTISGQGNMDDYAPHNSDCPPWYSYRDDIQFVIIESGVTSIGSYAFDHYQSLTSITIPNSVTSFGLYVFESCRSLTSIISLIENPFNISSSVFCDVSINAQIIVPKGTKAAYLQAEGWYFNIVESDIISGKCGDNVYYTYNETTRTLTIYGQGEMYSYEPGSDYIPWNSYSNDIQSVIIESGVTRIGAKAFCYCENLTSVTFPNSVTTIGGGAFMNCSSLSSVIIPNSVTHIEVYHDARAFDNTAWYDNQPDGLVYAGKVAYNYKGKMPADTHITLQEGTLAIAEAAFEECSNLTSITIPNGMISIGPGAFNNCIGLTSVIIPNSVTTINGNPFYGCSGLTSIQIGSDNQYYDSRNNCNAIIDSNNQLIAGCKNTIIPNSVTSIGNGAFYGCTGLVYITLPSKLTSIGGYCFYGCNNLTYIYCNAKDVPSAGNYTFGNTGNITLYVPSESVNAYKSISPWNQFNVQTNYNSQGTEKCSKPTISLSDGKYVFNCETPNVQYRWVISTPNGNTGYLSYVSHPITLNVFATKDGYQPSDVATYVLSGLVGDVNNDGEVNVADHVKLSEIIMEQDQ